MVKAYDATMEYHEKYPADEGWLHRYSHFLELYKRRGLKDWAEEPKNLEQFRKWIFDGKIQMAIHVRKLEKIILEDRNAYQALKNGAEILEAEDMMKESKKGNLSGASGVVDFYQNFQSFMESFPRNKMHEISKDKQEIQKLESLHKEFGQFISDIKKF